MSGTQQYVEEIGRMMLALPEFARVERLTRQRWCVSHLDGAPCAVGDDLAQALRDYLAQVSMVRSGDVAE